MIQVLEVTFFQLENHQAAKAILKWQEKWTVSLKKCICFYWLISNLTILNTHTERTDIKLCLVAAANQCVAINDNRKRNFIGTFTESDLKMSRWHSTIASVGFSFKVYSFKFWSNVGARLNVTCCFKCPCNNNKQIYITIGSFRRIYSHFRRLKFEIFLGEHAREPPWFALAYVLALASPLENPLCGPWI